MALRSLVLAFLCGALASSGAAAQKVHDIRLQHPENSERYRFEPNKIQARAGDILQFTLVSGGPYLVAFEPSDFKGPNRALMAAAIPGGNAELRAPALAKPGDRFRVTLPALPAGSYRFYSVTHVAYRMAGTLVVR